MDRISKRLSLSLTTTLLAEIERIAVAERRQRTDVVRLLIKMGTRYYVRRKSLLCAGPRCTRKDCSHEPKGPISGNLFEFPQQGDWQ